MLALSLLCLTLIYSNSIALNFTVICMDDVKSAYYQETVNTSDATPHWLESSGHTNALFSAIAIGCLIGTIPGPYLIHRGYNDTVRSSVHVRNASFSSCRALWFRDCVRHEGSAATPHWLESSGHTNALFSAIAIGCLIGTIPGPYLIHRVGVWGTMTLFGVLSTFATLAFPLAVHFGFVTVFVMRVLQGIGTSLSYPVTGLIASQWSTTKSAGTFIAVLSCHVQFCSIFTMPVSGALCETSLGWPSVRENDSTMYYKYYKSHRKRPSPHNLIRSGL
ncbi:hypothetical protein COOONC_04515 [Cooperia oncophora]